MKKQIFSLRRIHCGQWALASCMWSTTVFSDQTFVLFASEDVAHNSNVFELSGHDEAFSLDGDPTLADTTQRYTAGVDSNLALGSQKLVLRLEGRHWNFDHFSRLDHNEYLASGRLAIKMSFTLDGSLDYQEERRMAEFVDRHSTDLSLENERTGNARLNLLIDPEWRLETGLQVHELRSPLPGIPGFGIKDKSADFAVKYIGIQSLAAGIYINYLAGRFDGVPDNGRYHQQSLFLTADYSRSELSSIGIQLGYTIRQNDDNVNNQTTALTGLLKYHRELTGKTSIDIQAFRRLDSYVGGEGSVENTGADAKASWHITDKTSVNGDYRWSHSRFTPSTAISPDQNRKDNDQIASIRLQYQSQPWLSLQPYCSYQVRDSNIDIDRFRATIVGIDIHARFQ